MKRLRDWLESQGVHEPHQSIVIGELPAIVAGERPMGIPPRVTAAVGSWLRSEAERIAMKAMARGPVSWDDEDISDAAPIAAWIVERAAPCRLRSEAATMLGVLDGAR